MQMRGFSNLERSPAVFAVVAFLLWLFHIQSLPRPERLAANSVAAAGASLI
jgi:hypothetical protein